MNRKKEIQEELESISPWLAKIERPETPETPETPYLYFDKLADTVLNQVKEEKKVTWWNLFLNQLTFKNAITFASLALIVVASVLFLQTPSEQDSDPFAHIEETVISDYIAMNIEDFEESTLYEYTDLSNAPVDFLEDAINDADVEDLMDELIDEVDLETIEEFL